MVYTALELHWTMCLKLRRSNGDRVALVKSYFRVQKLIPQTSLVHKALKHIPT